MIRVFDTTIEEMVLEAFLVRKGRIVLLEGPMFSSKTQQAITIIENISDKKRVNKKLFGERKELIVKPKRDNRNSPIVIKTHDGAKVLNATSFDEREPSQIFRLIEKMKPKEISVVLIDEVWLCSENVIEVLEELRYRGVIVLLTALDRYYDGTEVRLTKKLELVADFAVLKHAVCLCCCEALSHYSILQKEIFEGKKFVPVTDEDKVLIGGSDKYIAACDRCYRKFESLLLEGSSPERIIEVLGIRDYLEEKGSISPLKK